MFNTVYDPYISSNVYEFNWQYWDTGVTPWVCIDISGDAIWMGTDLTAFNANNCKEIMIRKCAAYALANGFTVDTVNTWWGQFDLQPDWNETNRWSPSYIHNKPTVISSAKADSIWYPSSVNVQTNTSAANGVRLSTTKEVVCNVTFKTNTVSTLLNTSEGYMKAQVCSTNSATNSDWKNPGAGGNGQSGLIADQRGYAAFGFTIPTGWYYRLVPVVVSGSGAALPVHTYMFGEFKSYK